MVKGLKQRRIWTILKTLKAGDTVSITIVRQGVYKDLKITLSEER
ncbi:MAG: hypothetical protein Q8942_13545 [Bacillota bacterium]|nr:hypothetical protein [Bacillota bacterium]